MPMSELPAELERWRGEMDAFKRESTADRAGLHEEMRHYANRAEERHTELLEKLDANGAAARLAAEVIRSEMGPGIRAAQSRADDAHARIDRWEARAEGAGWVSRHLPTGIAAALGALMTYIATGKWPPGQ
jgi:multidrug resistance efflux pump